MNQNKHFRSTSGLYKSDSESQVNTLLYTMGSKSDYTVPTFGLSAEDSTKYDSVKDKFVKHIVKRRNVINKRAKFNTCRRKQEPGELLILLLLICIASLEHFMMR